MERLREEPFDLLLMDLNYSRDTTSGREGLELISRVRAHDPALPIVVMTGWGSIDTAVDAMRRGARSFVQKPWEDVTLLEILHREIAEARAARRRDHHQQRELDDARMIQRGLLPTVVPRVGGIDLAVAWQPMQDVGGDCFDTLTFARSVGISIADIAGKGLPAALLMSNLQAAVRAFAQEAARALVGVRERQPAAVPQHGERPLRHVLLRAHRARSRAGRLFERRPQSAAAGARRRHGRDALARRDGARHLPRQRLRTGRARGRAPAIASSSTPTGSPKRARRTEKSTARSGSPPSPSPSRAQPVEAMKDALMADVQAFTGGKFDDDATLIVVGL